MTSLEQSALRRNVFDDPNLRGGALVYRRTRRPTETCNVIASLAGLYVGEDRSR